MRKIICLLLATIMVAAVVIATGCDNSKKPDYSKYTNQFDFYGYSSANNGTYNLDGNNIKVTESLLTVEQYKQYKDCGMTIFFPQSALKISTASPSDDWNVLKKAIADVKSIGITKTIIYDERISWLPLVEGGLIGTGKKYATEADLDAKVKSYISLYAGQEGVYGVMLADEPKYAYVDSYAQVYKSIKRVCAANNYDLQIQFNLNPFIAAEVLFNDYYPYVPGTDTYNWDNCFIRYKKYITDYLDKMEPDYIQYDSYPLLNGKVADYYIPCLQFVAAEAVKRGIKFYNVTQTFEMITNGTQSTRGRLTKQEAKWLNNMLLGFGVQQISYFTYYTKADNYTAGELFVDNSSFVNRMGEPTDLYYTMKEIIANDQKFAPTILQFTYKASKIVKKVPMNIASPHISKVDNTAQFEILKQVKVDKNCALVNELYDKENKNYMYMAENVIDPANESDDISLTVTMSFDAGVYKNALVYRDGTPTVEKLSNGEIKLTLIPGDAAYVIPY